jgi:signal transduction histidine kinase
MRETEVAGVPVRVMTTSFEVNGARFVAQVIGDRTIEVRTLGALLAILIGGSVAVAAGAVAVGYVYAGRALTPIRESLRRQREFAADASHELRTPLAIISTALAQLRNDQTSRDQVDVAVGDLAVASSRMNQLVDDLLLLARADAEAVPMVATQADLGEVATDALAGFTSIAADREVRLRLDVEPSPVYGDVQRLRQLVGILVDNAIRHTPRLGAVSVRVRPGTELVVDDDGPGIRDEDLPNVFRRFWRAADAPSGGTGLGLAIAEWIVHNHGGRIRAGNRHEGGARFSVSLPMPRSSP